MLMGNPFQDTIDGDLLVIADVPSSALIGKGDCGKAVPPGVGFRERHPPQFIRRGITRFFAFVAGLHVDAVDRLPVGGVGESQFHLARVLFGLPHPFRRGFVPRFGFDDGQLAISVRQHVIGNQRFAPFPVAFDAAQGDGVFAVNSTPLDNTPTGGF